MDAYKLRNIVVSLQGGKHCFAKTGGCLLEGCSGAERFEIIY